MPEQLPFIEVTVAAFRTMTLSVLPFVNPDHVAAQLCGVRFTTDGEVAVAEAMTNVGGAHYRGPLVDHHGLLDRVLPHESLTSLLAVLGRFAQPETTVRVAACEDDRVQVTILHSGVASFSLAMHTYPGQRFPLRAAINTALRQPHAEHGVFDVAADVLHTLAQVFTTTGHRLVIHPGPRSHLATAGDELIAVVGAHRGVESSRFQAAPPLTTDLTVWRGRFA